jgi:hypothetical protein
MPPHTWPLTFNELADITNAWPSPDQGALLTWAMWAADGLNYLLDRDQQAFGVWPRQLFGHPHEAVDLSHVRWAAASAITTLDLCAGTLGRRRLSGQPGHKEYSLRDFDPRFQQTAQRLSRLTPPEQAWIKGITTDGDYVTVLNARNPMVHSRLKRTLYAGTVDPGPHEQRTGFPVGDAGLIVDSRPLIELCAAVATRHLEAFMLMIAAEARTLAAPGP